LECGGKRSAPPVWINLEFDDFESGISDRSKAVARCACHRTPKLIDLV
jgi:hypothetical protein